MNEGVSYKVWPRNPRYKAGADGSVVGPLSRILKPRRNKKGYLCISAYGTKRTDKRRTVPVHIIVCEAWHGMRSDPKLEVAHGNGVRTDCRPENLSWKSRAANARDSIRHGTIARGERHGCARLTESDIHAIREAYAVGGVMQIELAERYGVASGTISKIVLRKNWKHVSQHPGGTFVRILSTDHAFISPSNLRKNSPTV